MGLLQLVSFSTSAFLLCVPIIRTAPNPQFWPSSAHFPSAGKLGNMEVETRLLFKDQGPAPTTSGLKKTQWQGNQQGGECQSSTIHTTSLVSLTPLPWESWEPKNSSVFKPAVREVKSSARSWGEISWWQDGGKSSVTLLGFAEPCLWVFIVSSRVTSRTKLP